MADITNGQKVVAGYFKGVNPETKIMLYAWKNSTNIIYTRTAEPKTTDKALVGAATGITEASISAVGDDFASITVSATEYDRYDDGDVFVAKC